MYDLFIFYRKLVDAVKDEIYGERRQKIKERQEKIKNVIMVTSLSGFLRRFSLQQLHPHRQ
jgi:hypothetical protein